MNTSGNWEIFLRILNHWFQLLIWFNEGFIETDVENLEEFDNDSDDSARDPDFRLMVNNDDADSSEKENSIGAGEHFFHNKIGILFKKKNFIYSAK